VELRPDITVAAAKLTSGFDVSRELRQLGALLRDGEIVHRLAAGVYGSGGGLLAVTNRRVLLLRDGRGGQASEGFPLELLASVEWVAGPARGTIIVGDGDNTAELTQVEPVEGASVVKLIRSLVPAQSHDEDYDDEYDEYDELADAGEDALLTHGEPAMSGAGRGSRSQASRREDPVGPPPRSGRFAVTMKLRQPRDTPLGAASHSDSESDRPDPERSRSDRSRSGRRSDSPVPDRSRSDRLLPEQKSASERSMPNRAVRRMAETDRPDGDSAERRPSSSGGFPAGAVPVSALNGRTPGDLDRSAAFPEQYPDAEPSPHAERYADADRHLDTERYPNAERTGGTRRSRAATSSGGHSAVQAVRNVEGSGALGTKLVGEVPVRKLAEETGGQGAVSRIVERAGRSADGHGRSSDDRPVRVDTDRADRGRADRGRDRFEDDRFDRDRYDSDLDRFDDDRFDELSSRSERRPGKPFDRRSSRSDEPRGARLDDDLDDVPARSGDRRPGRTEDRRGARSEDSRRAMYDEDSGEFRRTRTAIDSGPLGAAASKRGRGDARSRSALDDDHHEGSRRSKWLWIGGVAAAVAALGAVGGVALLHHSDSPAAVNPAPAASDSLAGPVVRVTKVIDGDTIEVSGPVTGQVEVVGISAPRADKGQCGATAATAFASRTLAGTSITLVSDPSQPATDKSGRRLASLRTDNGFDYAVLAAGAGMVRYYDGGTPVAQAQDIKNAEAEAQKADRGLWGSPCNGKLSMSGSTASSSNATKASTSSEGTTSTSSKSTADKPASTSSSTR
jgi:endonuclease YncB( thermonuclease family)